MIAQLLFFLLAVTAIAAALGMLIARNPVSSALWLVLNLFCIAGLYLTLQASFLGVIQVLIYAGAIMVLFLFVIMLLNLEALPHPRQIDWGKVLAFVVTMIVLAQLVYVVALGLDVLPTFVATPEQAAVTGSAQTLGRELLTRYIMPLQVIGILLLAATIGAVMLAKRRFI
ncbi:NADH-quinone oxidoreductase subunit J family protein [Rhodothermus marinus]|uniref:NADH-quinone oxidoreductase subunit J family protein n=1 Tax=Rhodothermus marinus TaxID=29549 RepID=UPI0006D08F98|nr:NADH-quinone oxidoreductase subunit J [Rhodothermus marinus]BBM69465.1 NADH dehydrogenase [Rhodothermus marinus]BBM72447.1 NADH dehydrogenase [Rhodothermus marinus]